MKQLKSCKANPKDLVSCNDCKSNVRKYSDGYIQKDAEPVGYMREIRPGEFKYSRTSSWEPDVLTPLFTRPPNITDIEQRVAEAITHWIRCGDHHGVITSDDVLASKWREYL